MKDDQHSDFFTPSKYRQASNAKLTESMEDYIEMITRLSENAVFVRINELSKMLNVSPSSASKMVHKLCAMQYVTFPKYGVIQLTENGRMIGKYLIWRHQTLEAFLCLLNGSQHETKQVEQIEHYFNEPTLKNLEIATNCLKRGMWKPK